MKTRIAAAALVLVAILAVAFWPGREPSPADGPAPLRVGLLGAPWPDRVARGFAKVPELQDLHWTSVDGEPASLLAKLIAARGQELPFDIIELDDITYASLRKADLLEPISAADLPNVTDLDPSSFDGYRVAYWASQPALLYNAEKLAQAGVPTPKRYSDIADPRLAGHVWLPDVTAYTNFYAVLGLAAENGGSEENPQPGFDIVAKLRPVALGGNPATFAQSFRSGDAWFALIPASVAIRIKETGVPISVVHPPIHGKPLTIAQGYLGIVKGTKNRQAALRFLNAIISADVQESLYRESGISPVSVTAGRRALATLGEFPERQDVVVLDPALTAQAWRPQLGRIDFRDWVSRWQVAVDKQPK